MTRSVSVGSHITATSARRQHLLRADAEVLLVGHGREDDVALQRLFSDSWQIGYSSRIVQKQGSVTAP
jgi:hypothetical protein